MEYGKMQKFTPLFPQLEVAYNGYHVIFTKSNYLFYPFNVKNACIFFHFVFIYQSKTLFNGKYKV